LAVWLIHAAAISFWHAAGPYQQALASPVAHIVEHFSFFITAIWFWSVALSRKPLVSPGLGVLMIFGLALVGVFLAVLMTFAPEPWYRAYGATAPTWGLSALADQQLAGVIMWVPAGLVYTVLGIGRFRKWLESVEIRSAGEQSSEHV
jgi:putative membrane protein